MLDKIIQEETNLLKSCGPQLVFVNVSIHYVKAVKSFTTIDTLSSVVSVL